MRLLILSVLTILSAHAQRPGRALNDNDRELPKSGHVGQEHPGPLPGPAFNLKVQVSDMLSRQPLSQAAVEVYVNHSSLVSVLTGKDGGALLQVPYQSGAPVTVIASKDGYVCSLLPCTTSRTPDSLSPPVVQFPKSLLNLSADTNVTSFRAFLTVPKLLSEDGSVLKTTGIVSAKSGLVSVELSPVAALSVQLFSGDMELHVTGPVQLSLGVPDSCGAHISTVVPAWFFNRTTGGWMRKGLGKLQSVDGKLMWKFTAPHLGYWIAAPLSSTRGFFGLDLDTDFIFQHSPLLMLALGGALVFIASILLGLLCYRRKPVSATDAKRILPVTRKDQTTSTDDEDVFELQQQDGLKLPFSFHSAQNGSIIANLNTLDPGAEPKLKATEQTQVPTSLAENLFFYDQPVAILHAPAFFQLEVPEDQGQWNRSATLPRVGASNAADAAAESRDAIAQAKDPSGSQNQEAEQEDQLGVLEGSSSSSTTTNSNRGHYSLPESVSVPGTLNKIRDKNRHSLGEFAKNLQPARAWFVSLEGKPAAEIHYAVSEQHRRRRAVDSRDTSLDSGVDMSELNQASERRRTVTLERNNTFVKRKSDSKDTAPP